MLRGVGIAEWQRLLSASQGWEHGEVPPFLNALPSSPRRGHVRDLYFTGAPRSLQRTLRAQYGSRRRFQASWGSGQGLTENRHRSG